MKQIEGISQLTEKFPGWTPTHIAFIRRIELSVRVMKATFLSNISWADTSKGVFEINIEFENIRNCKFDFRGYHDFGGDAFMHVSGFDIIDISDDKWERINFKIEDYEDGVIGFYCENVRVISMSEPFFISDREITGV